jgi:endogenous inhibitor of DNA gyrase (YacG/DUF329 family)
MPRMVRCPTCRAEVPWEGNPHRPFCSERCRLIDLGAWAEGRYRIPGKKIEAEDKADDGDDE